MIFRSFIFAGLVSLTLAAEPQGAASVPDKDAVRILDTAPLRFEPAAVPGQFIARGARFNFEFSTNQARLGAGDKTFSLAFQGAARQARIEPADELRSKTNMFFGNDPSRWRSKIPNYARLEVPGLYPGIDLVYYGHGAELEYDLTVKPGADPRKIRLWLTADGAPLDSNSLVPSLIQKSPAAYQLDQNGARVAIASGYRKNRDGSYSFALGPYDHRRALVIDPVITLSLYIGGSTADFANAIGHDNTGFLYVAGTTSSSDFPVTSNAYQGALAGSPSLFMAKIDPNAVPGSQIVYATFFGGSLTEAFGGMAVGPNGDVYITGSTTSTDFPTLNPYQSSLGTSATQNAFLIWFNSSQTLAYSTYLGGSTLETGNAVAYDPSSGNVWVVGGTESSNFPIVGGYQTTLVANQDMFIAGFQPSVGGSGSLVYSSYLGGGGFDTARGVAVAGDGTLWIVGGTYSVDIPVTGNAYQPNYHGQGDAYVAHLNPSLGTNGLLYATYLGASALEEARSVVLDPAGPVIVMGYTISPDFAVTGDALQPAYGGNTDAFISILNPSASPQLVYSTFFGGSQGDAAFDIKRDSNGVLYLTGFTESAGLPVTAGALQSAYDGTIDVFVLVFNPARAGTAAIDYLTYLGSDGLQVGYGIDLDQGKIFIAGTTSGPIFDALGGVSKASPAGTSNGFVLGLPLPATPKSLDHDIRRR